MDMCVKKKAESAEYQQNCYGVMWIEKKAESAEDQQNCCTKYVFCSLFPFLNYWGVCFILFSYLFDIINKKGFLIDSFVFTESQKNTRDRSLTDCQDSRRVPGTIARPSTVASKWRKNWYLTHSVPTTQGFWDQKYINVDGCDFYIQQLLETAPDVMVTHLQIYQK